MSIRTFNQWTQKPGCTITSSVVLFLLMAAGMAISSRGCGGAQQQTQDETQVTTVATVGDYKITDQAIETAFTNESAQFPSNSATSRASLYFAAIYGEVQTGLALVEAKKEGLTITDQDVERVTNDQIAESTAMAQMGKNPPSQTELDQYKQRVLAAVKTALANPEGRIRAYAQAAATLMPRVLANRIKPTDAQVKDSFKQLTTRTIQFKGADVAGDVAKAQAELAKGETFEAVADKFSKEKLPNGNKPSKATTVVGSNLTNQPAYAPLLALKVGEVSKPLVTPQGTIIYKILSIKDNLPKDFDKNKESLRSSLAQELGQNQFNDDMKSLAKSVQISWNAPGWKALYDLGLAADEGTSPDDERKRLLAVYDEAAAARGGSDEASRVNGKPAALAMYASIERALTGLNEKEKAKYDDKLLSAISAVREFSPGADIELEAAKVFVRQKNADGLATALTNAISDDNDFSSTGLATYVEVLKMEKDNESILGSGGAKLVKEALKTWTDTKAQKDKDAADMERERKQQAAKDAAEAKAFQDEVKAQAAKEGKSGSPSTPPQKPAGPAAPGATPGMPNANGKTPSKP